jgi:hypothetical protein
MNQLPDRAGSELPLVARGLWLDVGFVGATSIAAGLMLAFNDPPDWLLATVLICCGTVVAVLSWNIGRHGRNH